MDIRLYNTLTKKKESLKPLKPGHVSMYHCGPTVYDRAHIGNLRSYVFADILRRTCEYAGLTVKQVINITDVGHLSSDGDHGEDKMTKALNREGMTMTLSSMKELGTKYMDAFVSDLAELNIEKPHSLPRASDYIEQDIEIVKTLEARGVTYVLPDGVYFDTSKFPAYGKLGSIDLEKLKEGARVTPHVVKRNPADFAVWKLSGTELGWTSPWGRGFPGWHIECSVMARAELGQPFDIHTGGIDHISVHHNNEIAQSEAAYGAELARIWMHNEFITVRKTKMSKSSGGFITLDALSEDRISPLAYRYWLLTGHYRSPLNFTNTALEAAQNALIRLFTVVSGYNGEGTISGAYKARFEDCLADDLNTPEALAVLWALIKDTAVSAADKKATIIDFDRVLGLGLASLSLTVDDGVVTDIPAPIAALADARIVARREKDWIKADALRTEIQERGFDVIDTETGYKIITRD
jgi:cysteinyl-tRNA synthetase